MDQAEEGVVNRQLESSGEGRMEPATEAGRMEPAAEAGRCGYNDGLPIMEFEHIQEIHLICLFIPLYMKSKIPPPKSLLPLLSF